MMANACESMASPNANGLTLLGKSIAFQRQPQTLPNKPSFGSTTSDTNVNLLRHSHRIKQLFLPVCLHEVKHEIANHYRDVKFKKAKKSNRAKAKRTLATAMNRLRKRNRFSKLAMTAASAAATAAMMHRRRMGLRRFALSQREVLQIPSFTFPRYAFQFDIKATMCTHCVTQWPSSSLIKKEERKNTRTYHSVDFLRCLTRLAPN